MKSRLCDRWSLPLVGVAIWAAVIVTGAGCGSGDQQAVMVDARTLLDRYQQDRLRHDPRHFSEVDLGEFLVTQRREPATLYYVRFKLFVVVPDQQVESLNGLLESRKERVTADIRETVQRAELEQLNEPTLDWLKSELIRSINRNLGMRLVRDVVFADFSFERG